MEQQIHNFPKFGMPATNAFLNLGYTNTDQLCQLTEKELLKIHGVGPKALGILKEHLAKEGKSLKVESK